MMIRSLAVAMLLATGSLAQAQGMGGGGEGGPPSGNPAATAAIPRPTSALPSGGVPAAGTVGGIGTPPADVQGKPGLSTPGANTRP